MPRGNKILIRTGSAAPSAADFATSEPAWDSSAGKLYLKNAAGSMVEVGAGGASSLATYATAAGFPAAGSATVLYLAEDTSRLYQWESGVYVEVGAAGGGFSHAASHAADGSDSLTLSANQIGSGTLDAARLPASAVLTSDARLSDSRSPTSHKNSHSTGGSDALSAADIGALTQATADGLYVNSSGDTMSGGLTINAATPLTVTGGRTFLAPNSEPYGLGVRYVSTGGPVYFGATDATATPGMQISRAGGVAMLSCTNAGAVSIPGSLTVGGSAVVVTTDARLTKTLASFTARDNQPPATNFATLDTRNSILVLEFDAATEESATFIGVINDNASLVSGLTVRLWWMADTATSGNVRWGVQLEKTGTDLDADSYDTNAQVTSAASGTSGIESVASIAITTIDSLVAGDRFRLRVYRVAADATNDTMTGDAQLVALEVRAA